MMKLYKRLRSSAAFALARNPRREPARSDFRKYIPEPYEAVAIISADFELAWAWRFEKTSDDSLQKSLQLARRERENVPKLLALSEKFGIPVTWGTVGHLFLHDCRREEGTAHPEVRRLPAFENEWWKFDGQDWFGADPCSSLEEAPEWYASDLLKMITGSEVKHEIACHTFSHISCADEHCPPEVLGSELEACRIAAAGHGLELRSFIFPGHTMGNYDTLAASGYTSMRTNFINVLGYPEKHENGIWEHKTTMELRYNPLFSLDQNTGRFRKMIRLSRKRHQVCNFWFHPSMEKADLTELLPAVYRELSKQKEKIWITTMNQYTQWLNSNNNG